MKFLLGVFVGLAGIILFHLFINEWIFYRLAFDLLDPPTIIFFIFAIVGVTIATSGRDSFSAGIKLAFSKDYFLPKEKLEESIELFKLLRKTVVYAGLLTFVIGAISTISFPNMRTTVHYATEDITVGVAVASMFAIVLTSIFYTLVLNLIFMNPIIAILQKRLRQIKNETLN